MMASRHDMQLQQGKGIVPRRSNSPQSLMNHPSERKGIQLLRRRGRPPFQTRLSQDLDKDIIRNKQITTELKRHRLKNKSPLIFHQGGGILWSEESPTATPLLRKNKSVQLPSFTPPVAQELSLQKRAKEFVSIITKEKKQLKGKYFLIRQHEEERRKLRTEIEEYEKSMIAGQYREGRRLKAQKKIQMLKERAQERQKFKNSRIRQRKMTQAESKEENGKRKDEDSASYRLKQAHVTFHPYEISVKPPKNSTKINTFSQQAKEVRLQANQSLKRIEEAKKMLSQLNRLILRQELLVRQESELTYS